jgi:hypothetical protein
MDRVEKWACVIVLALLVMLGASLFRSTAHGESLNEDIEVLKNVALTSGPDADGDYVWERDVPDKPLRYVVIWSPKEKRLVLVEEYNGGEKAAAIDICESGCKVRFFNFGQVVGESDISKAQVAEYVKLFRGILERYKLILPMQSV